MDGFSFILYAAIPIAAYKISSLIYLISFNLKYFIDSGFSNSLHSLVGFMYVACISISSPAVSVITADFNLAVDTPSAVSISVLSLFDFWLMLLSLLFWLVV